MLRPRRTHVRVFVCVCVCVRVCVCVCVVSWSPTLLLYSVLDGPTTAATGRCTLLVAGANCWNRHQGLHGHWNVDKAGPKKEKNITKQETVEKSAKVNCRTLSVWTRFAWFPGQSRDTFRGDMRGQCTSIWVCIGKSRVYWNIGSWKKWGTYHKGHFHRAGVFSFVGAEGRRWVLPNLLKPTAPAPAPHVQCVMQFQNGRRWLHIELLRFAFCGKSHWLLCPHISCVKNRFPAIICGKLPASHWASCSILTPPSFCRKTHETGISIWSRLDAHQLLTLWRLTSGMVCTTLLSGPLLGPY